MLNFLSPALLEAIQPFGVVGLVIVALIAIVGMYYMVQRARTQRATGIFPGLIAVLAIVAIIIVPFGLRARVSWNEVAAQADWGGKDVACSKSHLPAPSQCDSSTVGTIATCWRNRPGGKPPGAGFDECKEEGVLAWCTYKDRSVTPGTPADGTAPPGTVYICGRSLY